MPVVGIAKLQVQTMHMFRKCLLIISFEGKLELVKHFCRHKILQNLRVLFRIFKIMGLTGYIFVE